MAKLPTLSTVASGAQTIAKDCHTAHDLWRQGDNRDCLEVLERIAQDAATLSRQANEMLGQYTLALCSGERAEKQSYADLRASGGIVDAP